MKGERKELVSDTTLLIWIMVSAISTIACLLITAGVVYLVFGCWIMFQHQLAGGTCNSELNLLYIMTIPMALGLIIGTVITRKLIHKKQ